MRTVAQKMGIKDNSLALFINVPIEVIDDMTLPELNISNDITGKFDYIHLFVKKQSEYKEIFPRLKFHLNLNGMLWVSWPKGGGLGTDLSQYLVRSKIYASKKRQSLQKQSRRIRKKNNESLIGLFKIFRFYNLAVAVIVN